MSVQNAIQHFLNPMSTPGQRRQPVVVDKRAAAAIRWLDEPFRPNYPLGPFAVEAPMPATQADIAQLRGLLRWARSSNAQREPKERVLADALERAIAYLEEPDERKNVVGYILNALHQSYKSMNGTFVVRDRDLHDWAIQQINDMFGGPHVDNSSSNPQRRKTDS